MKFWIARDITGELCLYMTKPSVPNEPGYAFWDTEDGLSYDINPGLFPEVTFENSPREIEFKLVKEE
jgi:hypothetical protein